MFKKLLLMKPFKLFLTIMLPFLLTLIILVAGQSFLLYNNFKKNAFNQVISEHQTKLSSIANNVVTMKQTLKSLSVQAFLMIMSKVCFMI